jgi:hypothetical protein
MVSCFLFDVYGDDKSMELKMSCSVPFPDFCALISYDWDIFHLVDIGLLKTRRFFRVANESGPEIRKWDVNENR